MTKLQTHNTCKSCNKVFSNEMSFCPFCGVKLTEINKDSSNIKDLEQKDWSEVINMAKNYVKQRIEQGDEFLDEDVDTYIAEAVVETVYGKDIYEKLNKLTTV